MEDITDEEFMSIMDYLNKHTSPQETREIEARRAIDSIWDGKIKSVEEMRFKQRYAEARQSLQTVFSQPLTSDTPIVPLRRATSAWLSAASAVLLLGGVYIGYHFYQKNTSSVVQKQPDSTSEGKKPIKEIAQVSKEQVLLKYINEPIDTEGIPKNLWDEAKGIDRDNTRKKMIRRLEMTTLGSQVSTSHLPEDIIYGSGSDTLLSISADSARSLTKEKAYQQLLLGIGYLKSKEAEKALKIFNQINNGVLVQEINWYKALVYIQLGYAEKARAELLTLSKGRYKFAAQELLQAL